MTCELCHDRKVFEVQTVNDDLTISYSARGCPICAEPIEVPTWVVGLGFLVLGFALGCLVAVRGLA